MRSKTLKSNLVYILCLSMLISIIMPISSFAAEVPETSSTFQASSDSAYQWLKYQQDSAKVEGSGQPSGLVDSLEDFSGPNQPLTETFTYDQAVSAIAFLIKGDIDRAKMVLTAMKNLQAPDGSWVNSYWYNNLMGGELRKHVGPVMWMALAVENYEKITGDTTTYRSMAIKAIDWCLQFQKQNGALSGGQNMWDVPNTWSNEVWSSTEQNQDAYAALKYFATVEPQKTNTYNMAAESIKGFLDNVVWDSVKNRFYGGFKNNTQLLDTSVPLDCNPWGVMSLGLTGTHNYAASLDYVENAAGDANGQGTLENPKYVHTLTDTGTGNQITAYDFDWQSDHSAGDPAWGGGFHDADIWFEGSAFMACAYYMNGNTIKADSILNEIIKKQATNDAYCNGGLPYSLKGSQNNYWRMVQQNCVSSTGWFIIAAAKWNPFTGTSLVEDGTSTPETVAMPTFSVVGGTYTSAQQVAINCTTVGATIRYTLDGLDPTETSQIYSTALNIPATTTIKARAFKAEMTTSAVASAIYTIQVQTTPANIIGEFSVEFEYTGTTLTVILHPTIASATASNLWYTDITNPTSLAQAKAGYNTGEKNVDGNYIITIPNASIGINGLINLYLATNTGDKGWVSFNINDDNIPTPETVATPTFDVAGGTYTAAQQVGISCSTAGATIRYTLDGLEPTETSQVYSTPINVSATTTLKACAYKEGTTKSAVVSAIYTIDIPGGSGDVVEVGSGGYTLVPHGTQQYGNEVHERSYELQWLPIGDKRKTTENLTGPVPTNDWATSLIWGTMWTGYNQKYSEPLYAIPTIFRPFEGGVKMETPPKQVINGGKDIQKHYEDAFVDLNIGGSGFSADDARADKVTDWQYDFVLNNNDKTKSLKAIIMHGNPFGYFYFNNITPQISFTRGLPVKIISGDANSNVLLIKAMDNADGGKYNFYGIYAPQGTSWNLTGTADNITGLTANMPNGKNYISVASLPYTIKSTETENATEINDIFNTFKKYAYNYVTDTKMSYSYDAATREVITTFEFTTDNKPESTATGTITALFPHQYREATTNNYTGYTYDNTIRGKLKVVAGTSFITKEKFTGVLPTMPSWDYSDSEKVQMRAYLDELISSDTYITTEDPSKGLNVAKDTYWTGKELNKLSNALTVAEQIGYTEVADILYKTIKGELENWFTPLDSNGNLKNDKFFYYNDEVGTVIGYPSSFGSDTQLNDHHFHYGYFINAAAQVALRDSTWASKWGGMVQLLIDDIACTDRNSTMFPYLRAMDVYEGHSWASGHAQFGDGNNQESSSESINAWTGIILWGEAVGSQNTRDLGIYLYSTEKSAIHEYWYDQYEDIFDTAFNHEAVGMIWGGKYCFATWWTANPVETYGINFLPLAGGGFYLAEFKDKIGKVYDAAYVEGAAVNYADKGAAGATYWQDIMVKYLALGDPAKALANWKTDVTPEEGESKAFTYYWLKGLNNSGNLDASTYAVNSALSVVLKKSGIKTYIAYNPTGGTKEIEFNNGAKIQVAANSLYTGPAEGDVPAEQTVLSPVFSVQGGSYTSAQQVTLSCETEGATIRYTLDGSEPTETSTRYTGQIVVGTSKTIKARAYKDGMLESAVASAQYTINSLEVENIIGEFNARFKLEGTTLTITMVPKVASATISTLWYTDIANPTALAQAKGGYNAEGKNSEGNYVITIPNAAIGTGGLISLFIATNSGEYSWVSFNINGNTVPEVLGTPTFNVAGGTYTSEQQITLSCSTAGATIRYTLDGSEPTETSEVYETPIVVSATTTIKACAFKTGMTKSAIVSTSYTINIPIINKFTVVTTFKVGSTNNATALVANNLLDATATVTNNQQGTQQAILIVALYDLSGDMINVSYLSKNVAAGATESFHAGFKLPASVTGLTVKAFVWDGIEINTSPMTPLSNINQL